MQPVSLLNAQNVIRTCVVHTQQQQGVTCDTTMYYCGIINGIDGILQKKTVLSCPNISGVDREQCHKQKTKQRVAILWTKCIVFEAKIIVLI